MPPDWDARDFQHARQRVTGVALATRPATAVRFELAGLATRAT